MALRPPEGAPCPSRAARAAPASPAATHSAAPRGFPGRAPGGFGGGDSTEITAALAYAKAHDPGKPVGPDRVQRAGGGPAPSVIKGESVTMGGFTGRETVLTPSYLSSLVRSGEARYFLPRRRLSASAPAGRTTTP